MKKIRLTGPLQYSYKGTIYKAGVTYAVKDPVAIVLLRSEDSQTGFRYFQEVTNKVKEPDPILEPEPVPEPKTDAELEAVLAESEADSVIVEADDVVVKDLTDQDLI